MWARASLLRPSGTRGCRRPRRASACARELYNPAPNARKSQLHEALRAYKEARQKVDDSESDPAAYDEQRRHAQACRDAHEAALRRLAQHTRGRRLRLEEIQRARPAVRERAVVEARLAELRPRAGPPRRPRAGALGDRAESTAGRGRTPGDSGQPRDPRRARGGAPPRGRGTARVARAPAERPRAGRARSAHRAAPRGARRRAGRVARQRQPRSPRGSKPRRPRESSSSAAPRPSVTSRPCATRGACTARSRCAPPRFESRAPRRTPCASRRRARARGARYGDAPRDAGCRDAP